MSSVNGSARACSSAHASISTSNALAGTSRPAETSRSASAPRGGRGTARAAAASITGFGMVVVGGRPGTSRESSAPIAAVGTNSACARGYSRRIAVRRSAGHFASAK